MADHNKPSKSTCRPFAFQKAPEKLSKSDEKFNLQYQNAPRKIFIRPPCENETPPVDPTNSIIQASHLAIYILTDRFYDDLVRRQLASVAEVIRLQGSAGLRFEQLDSFSSLMVALLNKMSDGSNPEDLVLYTEVLIALIEIAGRSVESPSLLTVHDIADNLTKLYDAIGLVLRITAIRANVCAAVISAVDQILLHTKHTVVSNSQTDFAVKSSEGLLNCTLIPALIEVLIPIAADAPECLDPVLILLTDFQKYLPASVPIMLQHSLVSSLTSLITESFRDPCTITSCRGLAFITSELLLRLSSSDDPDLTPSILQNFSDERVIFTLLNMFERYFPVVHDTDKAVRSTLAMLFTTLIDLANDNLKFISILCSTGALKFCLGAAMRPECPSSSLRLQMHEADFALKQILLKAFLLTLRLKFTGVEIPANWVVDSLRYYAIPHADHKQSLWTRADYDRHRDSVLEILLPDHAAITTEFFKQRGSEILLKLLKGVACRTTTSSFVTLAAQPNLLRLIAMALRAVLTSQNCSEKDAKEFFVNLEGALHLRQIVRQILDGSIKLPTEISHLIHTDITFTVNHGALTCSDAMTAIQKHYGTNILLILNLPVDSSLDYDADLIRVLYVAVAIWIVASDEPESQFLRDKGPDRLLEIIDAAPLSLQIDLIQSLEKILFRSHRITKYVEYKAGKRFLSVMARLWSCDQLQPILHSIWLFVKNSWNVTAVCQNEDEAGFFVDVVDQFVPKKMFDILTDDLTRGRDDPHLVEEYKKLLLLLFSNSFKGLPERTTTLMEEMKDYQGQLKSIAAQVYFDVTGTNPLNECLYQQGVDEQTPKFLVSRSTSLFN